MDIATVRSFFMWCTIIDGVLLALSFIVCGWAGDWAYQVHSKWFGISREACNVVIYSFLGLFKLFFWVFNATPFIALALMG